jgi:ACT domain-containing protein
MFIEFSITLVDKPGELARLSTTLGDTGVNIEAIQGRSHNMN